jgi:serine/threonine protein kinase/tetratricopeptide (TPR) repeat protein
LEQNTRAFVLLERGGLRDANERAPTWLFTFAPSESRGNIGHMIGKTISHYRILSQVGEGGMGVVYVAEDTILGRRVAVKIPHAGKDEAHYRARFLREARAVSNLNHKNIAAVYDFGETDEGRPYIVMELVSGQTLGELLAGPGLSLARAVEIMREVADALAEAHRRGIVHRDIKPSNVVVNDRGGVKVLDFGLAKQLDEELTPSATPDVQAALAARTRSDVVIGTPLYLSPEQARGSAVDGRSDLFALGALLYECVAGRPAFSGETVIEIGAQVLHFDPPPPSRFNPRVPAELDRVTLKALAKKPEDRFQTAGEFSAELARVRQRLPDSDTTRTRRLSTAEHHVRSSALMSVAERLRRPTVSPLALVGALVGMLVVIFGVAYLLRPKIHKPSPEALSLYEQGVDAMRAGAYYKASGLLSQAVERDRAFALAHARLAEAWAELDFQDRAKDELLAAGALVPDRSVLPREDALYFDAVSATVRREFGAAVKPYEEIARLDADRPQVYVDLGRAYDKNNETEKAVKAFTEATTRDPSYAAAFLNLGVLQARLRNQAAALAAFALAEQLYVSSGNREGEAEVRYQRGRYLADIDKVADARPQLERSLQIARETNNQYQQVQALLQLIYAETDAARKQDFAREAIEIAESAGMPNLAALGHIRLATLLLLQRDYAGTEQHLNRALEFARTYKVRRLEALALFHLGSMYSSEGRPADAVRFVTQARDFYVQGNYRKEADTARILLGRVQRQQGDYAGAVQTFDEMLPGVRQSGDKSQLCDLERDYGAALLLQERYTEALEHFRESVSAARAIPDQPRLSYALLYQARALWPLARYDEARAALKEADDIAARPATQNKVFLADSYLVEAFMLLSQGRFADAKAKSAQALSLTQGAPPKPTAFTADLALCLADAYSGAVARGRQSCDEAARVADSLGDPALSADAQLTRAYGDAVAGDFQGAREAALSSEQFFARSGRVESDWRALAVAGIACRRAGDEAAAREYLARAGALLSKLQESLGADAQGYLSRFDVRRLRGELGDAAAAVAAVR